MIPDAATICYIQKRVSTHYQLLYSPPRRYQKVSVTISFLMLFDSCFPLGYTQLLSFFMKKTSGNALFHIDNVCSWQDDSLPESPYVPFRVIISAGGKFTRGVSVLFVTK